MKGFKLLQLFCLSVFLLLSQTSVAQNLSAKPELIQINVNNADADTIALALDGIGYAKAEAIIDYREQNRAFQSFDDLMMVSGIGAATIENNQDKIKFE